MLLSGISQKKGSRLSAGAALACGVTVATLLSPFGGGQAFAGDAQPPVAVDSPSQAPQNNNPKKNYRSSIFRDLMNSGRLLTCLPR